MKIFRHNFELHKRLGRHTSSNITVSWSSLCIACLGSVPVTFARTNPKSWETCPPYEQFPTIVNVNTRIRVSYYRILICLEYLSRNIHHYFKNAPHIYILSHFSLFLKFPCTKSYLLYNYFSKQAAVACQTTLHNLAYGFFFKILIVYYFLNVLNIWTRRSNRGLSIRYDFRIQFLHLRAQLSLTTRPR